MYSISKSECSLELSKRDPGKLNHSRWLTTANWILRLYVSIKHPSYELSVMAEFIIRVYAPMWFRIKCNASCTNGARHVRDTIKFSRYLDSQLKSVVDPVIQRNAYFIHPENLLICMLADNRTHIK